MMQAMHGGGDAEAEELPESLVPLHRRLVDLGWMRARLSEDGVWIHWDITPRGREAIRLHSLLLFQGAI